MSSLNPARIANVKNRSLVVAGGLIVPVLFGTFAVTMMVNVLDLQLRSKLYPIALGFILLALLASEAVMVIRERDGTTGIDAGGRSAAMEEPKALWAVWSECLMTIFGTIAFAPAIYFLGFYPATFMYVAFIIGLLSQKRIWRVALASLGYTVAVYLLFTSLFGARMFRGTLWL